MWNASNDGNKQPLSWKEARIRLRTVLEDYIEHPPPKEPSKTKSSWSELWFDYDMDVYAGSFLASLAFLVLSSLSLSGTGSAFLNSSAPSSTYQFQVAASVTMMAGCLFSAQLMARRRNTSAKDSDEFKRRAIIKYLAAEDNKEDRSACDSHHQAVESFDEQRNASIPIPGTSLIGIYPVYRTAPNGTGEWLNISSLLLVAGDFVALQVGDIAPANCSSQTTGQHLAEGQRIVEFSDKDFPSAPIPSGKVTIPSNSQAILSLCNLMQIFVVETAPIERLLRRSPSNHRSPQAHRQLHDIRRVMYLFSIAVFIISFTCIAVRPGIWSSDVSIVLHAPLLAAMGCLPIISPLFLMFLEILGTARILTTVHPFATRYPGAGSNVTLLLRYIVSTISSRLWLRELAQKVYATRDGPRTEEDRMALIPIPSASMCLLERLGVATAFCLVDDELACGTNSNPQQLLIPSSTGLKLLDLCPVYEYDDEEGDSDTDSDNPMSRRRRPLGSSSESSDSDADVIQQGNTMTAPIRKLNALRKRVRRRRSPIADDGVEINSTVERKIDDLKDEVQFEDPLWWQHIPSLKCIGLACLLVDQDRASQKSSSSSEPRTIEEKLIQHISIERRRKQFQSLASCIGFQTEPNSFGAKGDLTPFSEVARFHIISSRIFKDRLTTDTHALGLEDARNWGKLRTDSTSVIVQDARSKAYQLLTVGDPQIVTALCQEAWQGENLTIFPLSSDDRQNILNIGNDWNLADLDVAAFSYTPIPQSLALSLVSEHGYPIKRYLLDNPSKDSSKDGVVSGEWAMIASQIFLGVLGSSIIPRKEIEKLLASFAEAGLRFVYFSPRNMRRTKEVASQMGIDVAWNCAISLRPLDAGEDDKYRMVSNDADWVKNAKLPSGIEDVRKHLKDVDNVPLLVSLFTDVTKESTTEMIETFQEYNDTVIAMGLSRLSRNAGIFDVADLSIGVDVLLDGADQDMDTKDHVAEVFPYELALVSSISTSSCVFRLQGTSSIALMPQIIASGRAAFEKSGSAVSFVSTACCAYSLYIVFSMCTVATVLPLIPALGSVLFLLVMLPLSGLSLALGKGDSESMKEVPEKNDQSLVFGKNERIRVYKIGLLKSLLPAICPQVLWLIAFGELMIEFEPDFVREKCNDPESWVSLIRCINLREHVSWPAETSAGSLALAELMLCILASSGSFLHRTKTILQQSSTELNLVWIMATVVNVGLVLVYLALSLQHGSLSALPWYFFIIAIFSPFLCLLLDEWLKINNRKNIKRAVMMRRLQFETRLGMWSPK